MKLYNNISTLKQEKTQLQQNLVGLQRRIGEIELAIGGDHPNAALDDWKRAVVQTHIMLAVFCLALINRDLIRKGCVANDSRRNKIY